MFLNDDQLEQDVLRQGDIICAVHYCGAINLSGIQYTHQGSKPDEFLSWTVPAAPKFGDAMILSHSCEISLDNRMKVTSIILAPIRDIHTATSPKKIEELIESNFIDRLSTRASFLKYFYISPNDKLMFSSGAIVDFSKCFSVRKNSYEKLLENKIAQMTKEFLLSMALKLALFFHREQSPRVA